MSGKGIKYVIIIPNHLVSSSSYQFLFSEYLVSLMLKVGGGIGHSVGNADWDMSLI